jgi:uncharacterized protein YkwD
MSVRRLLTLSLLVMGLLAVPVPITAGPRTDAAFVRATNADRREHGLKAMKTSRLLAKLARSHSVAMARKSARRYGGRCDARALWHNDISKATGRWLWLGQNVGCGSAGSNVAASARRIQDAFMNSPGHRRNILYRKANLLGVGTHIKGRGRLGHGQLRADHARLEVAGRYPLTARR